MSRVPAPHSLSWASRLLRGRIGASVISLIIIALPNAIGLYLIASNVMAYFSGRVRFEPQVQLNQVRWSDDPLFDHRLHSRVATYVSSIMHSAATRTLNPLALHNEFGKIDGGIIEFSLKDSIVRRATNISEFERAHIVVDTIIAPLIECMNQLKNEIPHASDAGAYDNTQ